MNNIFLARVFAYVRTVGRISPKQQMVNIKAEKTLYQVGIFRELKKKYIRGSKHISMLLCIDRYLVYDTWYQVRLVRS